MTPDDSSVVPAISDDDAVDEQEDRNGTTLRRWSLSCTWPVKSVPSDCNNKNFIESATLTYDFFELVQ